MNEENDLLTNTIENKGIITLNRKEFHNSLSINMLVGIIINLNKWSCEKDFVLIKGYTNVFSIGADVKTMIIQENAGQLVMKTLSQNLFEVASTISKYPKPTVSLINGYNIGGSLHISAYGRYRITTEKTKFSIPEANIGFKVPGTYFLSRLPNQIGLYLALTGAYINGSDLYILKIATHYCKSEDLELLEEELMSLECKNDADIEFVLNKYNCNEIDKLSFEENVLQINNCFAARSAKEIMDNLNEDDSKWAKDTINILNKISPTSFKLIIKQMDLATHMTLDECLHMEFIVGNNYLGEKQIHEGVRALLIDADNKPNWIPSSLNEVTDDYINSLFNGVEFKELRKL